MEEHLRNVKLIELKLTEKQICYQCDTALYPNEKVLCLKDCEFEEFSHYFCDWNCYDDYELKYL